MWLKNRTKGERRQGWLSAVVVFAAGVMAASVLLELDLAGLHWQATSEAGSVQTLRASNTRSLVLLPLPLR